MRFSQASRDGGLQIDGFHETTRADDKVIMPGIAIVGVEPYVQPGASLAKRLKFNVL